MVVIQNPNNPAPQEVLAEIVEVPVRYIDFSQQQQDGVIEVNKAVAEDVSAFFKKAFEILYPIEKVVRSSDPQYGWDDGKLLEDNASSGFNYRLIKGTNHPSLHGLGLAIDINTRINPYIRSTDAWATEIIEPEGAVYDPSKEGALTTTHPLVTFLKGRGWEWGGDWYDTTLPDGTHSYVTDYQHFQKKIDL